MFRPANRTNAHKEKTTSGLSLRRSPSQNVQHAVIDTSNT